MSKGQPKKAGDPSSAVSRRAASLAMATGLVAGYGTCAAAAVRYVYPTADKLVRLYVTDLSSLAVGSSLTFVTPSGMKLAVTRHGAAPTAESFIALSSTCPHLGCKVHWEAARKRFFCPCHNGVFDTEGRPLEGPPKAANTPLLRYRLAVEGPLLFVEVPERELA